jgi:hypothetical protein
MNTAVAGLTRVIPECFEKSVPLVRRLLSTAGCSIVGEFDLSTEPYLHLGIARRSCLVLLVDTPVLLFASIALDRSAAAFLPMHIVISGDRDTSYVHWINPVTGSGLRPPAPAKGALENLYARVTEALSELPETVELSPQASR